MLLDVTKPYPMFTKQKRTVKLDSDDFEAIKKFYDYRCVTCGSKEGEKNFLYPNVKTELQKGHKDPTKPLEVGNVIPQCQFCNRPDRNYFIFNDKGRVVAINDPNFILRSTISVQKNILKILVQKYPEEARQYYIEKNKKDENKKD